MKILSRELLDEVVRRLVREFHPEKIILFGSHAWGTPTQDSDMDLLVIVASSNVSSVQRAVKAHRCLRGLNVSKDILVKTRGEVEKYRGIHASLEAQILEQGRVLYG